MSKSYYKLEVDTNIWRKFKAKCAQDGKTMLEKIIEMIEQYVSKK